VRSCFSLCTQRMSHDIVVVRFRMGKTFPYELPQAAVWQCSACGVHNTQWSRCAHYPYRPDDADGGRSLHIYRREMVKWYDEQGRQSP